MEARHTKANGIIRPCCGQDSNLQVVRNQDGTIKEFGEQVLAKECRACGRKHYTMIAEPGVYKRIVSSGRHGTLNSIR